ncbi:MAG: NAD-dependent epimerase/dehydratase family protein [Actinomycetota bacterium]
MAKHLVVGAGTIGRATARLLADRSEQVTLVSRSGVGPDLQGVRRVALDVTDGAALSEIATGSTVLYNCLNPAYQRWLKDWPPMAQAMLAAAERSGAVLATVSNLYAYGAVDAPMTENTALNANSEKGRLRKRMWLDAKAAHDAGRVRATEVRSADFIGPGSQSHLGDRVIPKLLAGKNVQVLKSADTLHTWSFTVDVARLLVEIGSDERAWGRAWHVPSNQPRTQREAIGDLARVAKVEPVKVTEMPAAMLKLLSLFMPVIRELPEVAYQIQRPFILDSTQAQETFGLKPTPWDDVLEATIASYRK